MTRGLQLLPLAILASFVLHGVSQASGSGAELGENCLVGGVNWIRCNGNSDEIRCDRNAGVCVSLPRQEGDDCDGGNLPCDAQLRCAAEYNPASSRFDAYRCRTIPRVGDACECETPEDCQSNQGCLTPDPTTGQSVECRNFECVVDPTRTQSLGQDCATTPVDNCFEDLRCVDGECVPYALLEGESCYDSEASCVEGTECFEITETCLRKLKLGDTCLCDERWECHGEGEFQECSEGSCIDGECRDQTIRTVPVGGPCNEDFEADICVEGATCEDSPDTGDRICYGSPRQLGDACESNWNIDVDSAPEYLVRKFCAEGLQCRGRDPMCVVAIPLFEEGDACARDSECREDLVCDEGTSVCISASLSLGDACPCNTGGAGNPRSCRFGSKQPECVGQGDEVLYCENNVCKVANGQPGDTCAALSDQTFTDPATGQQVYMDTCSGDLRCAIGAGNTCSHYPALVGEACTGNGEVRCGNGLACVDPSTNRDSYRGVCVTLPSEGDSCPCENLTDQCRYSVEQCWEKGVYCIGGTCVRQSIQTGEVGDDCTTIYTKSDGNVVTCRPGLKCSEWFDGVCEEVSPTAGLEGDPHMVGFNGLRFDYDGRPGQAFDLVSTPDISINALIMPDLVHGMTYVGALGISSSCGHTAVIRADAAEDRLTLEVDDSVVETLEGHPVTAGSLQLEAAGGGDVRVTVAGVSMVVEVHKRIFLNVKDMAFTHGVPAGVTGVLGHTARPDRAQAQGLEHAEEYYFVDSLLDKSARPTRPRRMGVVAELLAEASQVAAASMIHSVTA